MCYSSFLLCAFIAVTNGAWGGNVGGPLILTPFVESGKLTEGREAARVLNFFGDFESYAGFFTVNKTYGSNMFLWFFPAEEGREKAPVVLWLQGGPGVSLIFGIINENGPYTITAAGLLGIREQRWNKVFNMIYIDNPVGTGFSFTGDGRGYATDQDQIALELYSTLVQFFQLFPEYEFNDFYVMGESYAGKYVPSLARTIHHHNPNAKLKLNMKGLAFGNGFSAPDLMLHFSDYLYQIGLIDYKGKTLLKAKEQQILEYMKEKDWSKAAYELLDFENAHGMFTNLTSFTFRYNYLIDKWDTIYDTMFLFASLEEVRRGLHVGNQTFTDGSVVARNLSLDFPKSVRPAIEEILDAGEYRVMIYNGQTDIACAYPLTVNMLRNLEWSGIQEYLEADRKPWYVGGELAGYTRNVGPLKEVLVRNAGHLVPIDQPVWAMKMMSDFTNNKDF